ncbi:MAG: hypothetical protein U5L11_12325 [Arhodomonas sp.]|nr:hypothetical protein [Arhodomonas sp.]
MSADTARAEKPAGKDEAGRARGYQESEHVRRYYDLARFLSRHGPAGEERR